MSQPSYNLKLDMDHYVPGSTITLTLSEETCSRPGTQAADIRGHLDTVVALEREPRLAKVTAFIGHGRSGDWQLLANYLRDCLGINPIAFETGCRQGYSIQDVLADMVGEAMIAFIIMTAEDEGVDGAWRARENVIHEYGVCQGRLGSERTIVLLEEGCHEFSNLAGNQQLRYERGRIAEKFGEVAAIIKREFGSV